MLKKIKKGGEIGMVHDSFVSENGDRYTLELKSVGWCICKNGNTDSYASDNDEGKSHMIAKFKELKYLIGK
jgi:hypothetical protein